jgi:hypothetical protein
MDGLEALKLINQIAAKLLAAAVLIHFAASKLSKPTNLEKKIDAAVQSITRVENELKSRMENPEQWPRVKELLKNP